MKTVYLKNGQQADLIKEVDGKFLVAPYYTYNGYEGEEYSEAGTSLEMVTEVFKSPPVAKLHEEYKSVLEQLESAKKLTKDVVDEKNKALSQYQSLVKQTTDLEKFIVNRSQLKSAKRITVFPAKSLLSVDYPIIGYSGYNLSFVLRVWTGEEQAWSCTMSKDYGEGISHYLDLKAGIHCDLTDDEIEKISIERIASHPASYFYTGNINKVDDKYLTEELKVLKATQIADEKQKSIEKLNKEISDAQEKLKLLEAKKGQVV